jgi:uncharacterized RDD family membrane protein YckC
MPSFIPFTLRSQGGQTVSGTLENQVPLSGPQYGSFGKRLVAYFIDVVVSTTLSGITVIVSGFLADGAMGIAGTGYGVIIGYYILFWAIKGTTPGKAVFNLKIVDAGGNMPGLGRAVLRFIGYFVLFIGFIWILIDGKRQGLHDKIAGTYVIEET